MGGQRFALRKRRTWKGGDLMGFLGALGWVLFAFSFGFFIGLGLGSATAKKANENASDRKVAEK